MKQKRLKKSQDKNIGTWFNVQYASNIKELFNYRLDVEDCSICSEDLKLIELNACGRKHLIFDFNVYEEEYSENYFEGE